jgi:hypothetical protein
MRILVLSTSTNNTQTFVGSLYAAGYAEADVDVFRYDAKFHQYWSQRIQTDPVLAQQVQQTGGVPHTERDNIAMDDEMLRHAKLAQPDAIVYISARWDPWVPFYETLGELNSIAPVVHFLSDGADPPWWDELERYERNKCFTATVSIDGSHAWPGGKGWRESGTNAVWCSEKNLPYPYPSISNCLTLLTPIDTRAFEGKNHLEFHERPYAIAWAGNSDRGMREAVIERLRAVRGCYVRMRDTNPNSYPEFAKFLRHARVVPNVPFSGSGAARQVKGRVLEAGFAGCCLLEWKNEATRSWFNPRNEFFEYESVEEAAEMAEWLSHHSRIAGEAAAALKERVTREHHPKVFWEKVMGALGK